MTLPVLTSPLLNLDGVRHAFFTRRGGVSTGLYDSLNVGVGSKDDPDAVRENRRRVADHFDQPPEHLLTAYQVHSPDAVIAAGPWDDRPHADAVVTATPGLVCGAMTADCAPVLLADAEARVAAACHAGWKGALTGVVEATVARMTELGAQPRRIRAVIGPCIGPGSYEVGLDFLDRFQTEAPGASRFFRPAAAPGKHLFDLPAFVLHRLNAAGVTQAEWIGADTLADEARFFSNRRAYLTGASDYGRLISAIMLD
ncbi:MAG: peptidoglycan editing factor PgeF [Caulobacteraceae bacterium]